MSDCIAGGAPAAGGTETVNDAVPELTGGTIPDAPEPRHAAKSKQQSAASATFRTNGTPATHRFCAVKAEKAVLGKRHKNGRWGYGTLHVPIEQ